MVWWTGPFHQRLNDNKFILIRHIFGLFPPLKESVWNFITLSHSTLMNHIISCHYISNNGWHHSFTSKISLVFKAISLASHNTATGSTFRLNLLAMKHLEAAASSRKLGKSAVLRWQISLWSDTSFWCQRYTGSGHRTPYRKQRETKQLPVWLPDLALHGCCLVYLHFLWEIL